METVCFVVDETPYACSDGNLQEKNREFLRGIDPQYFAYSARAHLEAFGGDDSQRAAIAIRVAYSQGLEALFSYLCSAIQAPECVLGWLLAYRNFELESAVRKINAGQPIRSRLRVQPTWQLMSRCVHEYLGYDEEKTVWIREGFSRLWSRLAREFLDVSVQQEYNSIKHGLRPRPGGFSLRVGREDVPGTPAPPEAMRSLGGSEYGSTFFVRERIGDKMLNFRSRRQSRNWHPRNLVNGLALISMSLNNVVSFLRIVNGDDPKNCVFQNPADPADFDTPWAQSVGVTSFNMDNVVREQDVDLRTKDEVYETYDGAS